MNEHIIIASKPANFNIQHIELVNEPVYYMPDDTETEKYCYILYEGAQVLTPKLKHIDRQRYVKITGSPMTEQEIKSTYIELKTP